MRLATLFLIASAALTIQAQDIDRDDVPKACRPTCQKTVKLTKKCDRQTNTDKGYIHCVCSAKGAKKFIPKCQRCISHHGDKDNDAKDIVKKCNF